MRRRDGVESTTQGEEVVGTENFIRLLYTTPNFPSCRQDSMFEADVVPQSAMPAFCFSIIEFGEHRVEPAAESGG